MTYITTNFVLYTLSFYGFHFKILISKGFLKQLTIKTNGKNSRRFDRSSVIIKRNVENKNLHRYIK